MGGGRTDGRADVRYARRAGKRTDGRARTADERTDGTTNGRTGGRPYERTDGWTGEQPEKFQTHAHFEQRHCGLGRQHKLVRRTAMAPKAKGKSKVAAKKAAKKVAKAKAKAKSPKETPCRSDGRRLRTHYVSFEVEGSVGWGGLENKQF